MSKFSRFVGKLEARGYSAESARKIAASAGAKKYGWKGMAKKSTAARKRHRS